MKLYHLDKMMNILSTIIELLKRIPELPGIIIAALIPIVVPLYGKYLDKRKKDAPSGPKTITFTAPTGKSVTIKPGKMSDEEIEQAIQRLRELEARANASTSGN